MIELKNTTLVAIDGRGDDINTIKALKYSSTNIKFENIKYINSGERKIKFGQTIKIDKLNWNDYNKFCLVNLINHIETEYVLLIQNDGFVLNANYWTDEYLKYDYLGAPWPMENLKNNLPRWKIVEDQFNKNKKIYQIGNGGFTLRSKNLLSKTKQFYEDNLYTIPEDILISIYLREKLEHCGLNFCSDIDFAAKFSCEANVVNGKWYSSNNSFGFHCKDTHRDKILLLNDINIE